MTCWGLACSIILGAAISCAAPSASARDLRACYVDAFARFDQTLAQHRGYYERAFLEPGPLGLKIQTARRQTRALPEPGRSEAVDPVTGVIDVRKTMTRARIALQFPNPAGGFYPEFEIRVERCDGPDAHGAYQLVDVSVVPGDPRDPSLPAQEVRSYLSVMPDTLVINGMARPAGSDAPFAWAFTEVLTTPR